MDTSADVDDVAQALVRRRRIRLVALPAHLRSLAVPVAVGLLIRLIWIVATARSPNVPLLADPVVYEALAERAKEGHFLGGPGFPLGTTEPASFLSVGYPSVLGIVAMITRLSAFHAAMLVNLVASAVIIAGSGLIARKMSGLHSTGVIAAGIAAIYPDLVTATGLIMSDLVGLAIVLALATAVLATPHSRSWIVIGTLLACSVWVRASLQLLMIALPGALWMFARRRDALRVLALSLVLVAPLAWQSTYRVHAGFGLTSATWINICDGITHDPGVPFDGTFHSNMVCDQSTDEGTRAQLARDTAIDAIRANPGRFVRLTPLRLQAAFSDQSWGIDVAESWSHSLGFSDLVLRYLRWISSVGYAFVAMASIPALMRFRRTHAVRVGLVISACSLAGVLVTFGAPRFAIVTIGVLAIPGAAVTLEWLRASWRPPFEAPA